MIGGSRPALRARYSRLVRRFGQLSWRERGMLARAVWFLALARVMIRFVPFRHWAQRLGPIVADSAPTDAASADDPRVQAVITSVERSAPHLPWRAVCLPRAMAAKWMLDRKGVPSLLSIGVRLGSEKRDLHAWLSLGDRVVLGGPVDDYATIARFGPRARR